MAKHLTRHLICSQLIIYISTLYVEQQIRIHLCATTTTTTTDNSIKSFLSLTIIIKSIASWTTSNWNYSKFEMLNSSDCISNNWINVFVWPHLAWSVWHLCRSKKQMIVEGWQPIFGFPSTFHRIGFSFRFIWLYKLCQLFLSLSLCVRDFELRNHFFLCTIHSAHVLHSEVKQFLDSGIQAKEFLHHRKSNPSHAKWLCCQPHTY